MRKFIFLLVFSFLILNAVVPAMAQDNQQENTYYSVLFNEKEIPPDFTAKLESCGAELVYAVPEIGFAQIKGDCSTLPKVKRLPSVMAVSPSISVSSPKVEGVKLQDVLSKKIKLHKRSLWELQWDIKRVTENGASYKLGTGSHDVVVGIIDSGIDRDHPDLKGNLLPGSKNFVPAGGFRGTEPGETGNPGDFDDLTGHGTHVAGAIAANGNMLGVAPDVGIRAYRVFGKAGAESAWIFAAITAAADDGVDVISMSFSGFDIKGQYFYTDPVTGEKMALGNDVADFLGYKRAVQYAMDKGCLVVAAAGNGPINATNKKEVTDYLNAAYGGNGLSFEGAGFEIPGTIPGVITVSATGPDDNLALYSNYGPGFVDIAAPGGDIRLYNQYDFNEYSEEDFFNAVLVKEFCMSTWVDGGYFWNVGTSMATPKVSAVAALIIDKYGKMDPTKLAKIIRKKSVEPVTGKNKSYYGSGYVNAVNALTD